MKIAVLDDEEIFREDLREKILVLFASMELDITVDCYSSATGLIPFADEYQLIFVDYRLADCTGIDFASVVREKNNAVGLVFVSNYPEYVFDTFKVNAYRFLRKPIDPEELEETVMSFINESDKNEKVVLLNYVSEGRKFTDAGTIMYVESSGKHSFVTFGDGTEREVVSGFSETVRVLSMPYAECSSRGVFVCFPHVDVYKKTDIIMKNGRKFSVSRNCRTQFESKWINYLKNK